MAEDIEDTLIFVRDSGEAAIGGFGNDLMNADDVVQTTTAAGDSEWRYVPVRRMAVETDGDIAGNFRDTAEGETGMAADPYAFYNFQVDLG